MASDARPLRRKTRSGLNRSAATVGLRGDLSDLSVRLGRGAADDPQQLADEIATAAALFTRTIDVLPLGYELRPIFYNWPVPATRTLGWVAAQALHECQHHYDDALAQT